MAKPPRFLSFCLYFWFCCRPFGITTRSRLCANFADIAWQFSSVFQDCITASWCRAVSTLEAEDRFARYSTFPLAEQLQGYSSQTRRNDDRCRPSQKICARALLLRYRRVVIHNLPQCKSGNESSKMRKIVDAGK